MRRRSKCKACNGSGYIEREHFVYTVLDAEGECLYVGRTAFPGEFGLRWNNHRRTNPEMVAEAAHFRLMGPYTFPVAVRVEIEQQLLRRPRYGVIRATHRARAIAQRLGIEVVA
jgi:hypothetical protein